MAVIDVKNRDMNGFSKQKIPNLAHTYGRITHLETPSCHHERKAMLLHPTSPYAPLPTGQRCSWPKCSRPALRLPYKLSTYIYIYPYGITLSILYDAHEQKISHPSDILGKYYSGYWRERSWLERIFQTEDHKSCTYNRRKHTPRDPLLPPRAKGSAPAPDESPCLPSYGATMCMAQMQQARAQTTIQAINIYIYIYPYGITLTTTPDDAYEQKRSYPSHMLGKYHSGYWREKSWHACIDFSNRR